MKRLLILLALALGCSDAPSGPGSLPNVAGVWRFDGTITDSGVTCRLEAVSLYLSQRDSVLFDGQTKDGVYACTDGTVFPFPVLYVIGNVNRDRTVRFDLVPYFQQSGRLQYDGQSMSGQMQYASIMGRWYASRITP